MKCFSSLGNLRDGQSDHAGVQESVEEYISVSPDKPVRGSICSKNNANQQNNPKEALRQSSTEFSDFYETDKSRKRKKKTEGLKKKQRNKIKDGRSTKEGINENPGIFK
jgi:hypothetical protein